MSDWVDLRDTLEIGGVLALNYLYPGSSIVTTRLASDNAREFLDSKEGRGAQVITGGSGIYNGNLANYTGGSSGGVEGEPVSSSEPLGQSGSGSNWTSKLNDLGRKQAIDTSMDSLSNQQQAPQKDVNADRRQALMDRAADLRRQIAELRQQMALESSNANLQGVPNESSSQA